MPETHKELYQTWINGNKSDVYTAYNRMNHAEKFYFLGFLEDKDRAVEIMKYFLLK